MANNYYKTKYDNHGFKEMLDISQGLVHVIEKMLLYWKFIVRPIDDSNPFKFPGNSEVRGLDIFCAKNGKSYFIDAKDFARLIKHPATGIARYIYDRYKTIQEETGIKALVFFIDNAEFENATGINSIFKVKNRFIPYGNYLDKFDLYYNQNILNQSGRQQIIWKYETMLPIYEIFGDNNK